MTLTFYLEEKSFVVTGGWPGLVMWDSLEEGDIIIFYRKPKTQLEKNHCYKIKIMAREERPDVMEIGGEPEFIDKNLLVTCVLDFSKFLNLDEAQFTILFPETEVPSLIKYKDVRLKLTDATNKDSCIRISFRRDTTEKTYRFTRDWENFIN